MKYQEIKYRVDSLNAIQKKLKTLGAKQIEATTSIHYYTKQTDNNVIKLVKYTDRSEIRLLEQTGGGKFRLRESIPVADDSEGFKWLKKHGFSEVEIVKMDYVDYQYKNGIVGLYIIDDFLSSVILDFPGQDYKSVERELGLTSAERIEIFYNELLRKLGRLESISLN